MHIDLDIVIYAVVTVVLVARLWSLLGTRNEDEPQRPNPFVPPVPQPQAEAQPPSPLLAPPAHPPASLAGGLAQVIAVDAAFNEKQFLQEAQADFTAIVQAYAGADMAAVAGMLSPSLLTHFQQAAETRRAAGQTAQTRILKITDADAVEARAEGSVVFITVKFISQQENILRDARGAIIGGVEGKAEEVTDVWTFSRDAAAADSKWVVVATRG